MNILIVAAHPDDEALGCGTSAARRAPGRFRRAALYDGRVHADVIIGPTEASQ